MLLFQAAMEQNEFTYTTQVGAFEQWNREVVMAK